jgi:hypothetical protein
MQARIRKNSDRAMWIEVERLCCQVLELAESVQVSIREYPGLNLAGGYLHWELLNDLRTHGARSISDLVESHPATREWIRRLAGDLVVAGLAEFVPNPNRRKSHLVQITALGELRCELICGDLDNFAHGLTLDPKQVSNATAVIEQIKSALAKVMETRRHMPPSFDISRAGEIPSNQLAADSLKQGVS